LYSKRYSGIKKEKRIPCSINLRKEHVTGDDIKQLFEDKEVGDVDALPGTKNEMSLCIYTMKEPDYTMMMMTLYGKLGRLGKVTKRKLNKVMSKPSLPVLSHG
jgi:hypothetical protein